MAARETCQDPSGDYDGRVCARGEYCADATVTKLEDGTVRRDPAPSPRPFCDRDRGIIEHDLAELPGQYVHLAVEIGNPARRGTPVHVPFGPRIILRIDIEALMRAVAESLCSWHERIAVSQHLGFPESGRRDSWAIGRAAEVLSAPGRVSALLALQPQTMRRACDLRDLAALPDGTLGVVHSVFAEIDLDLDGTAAGLEILHLRYLARAVLGETRDKPEELLGVPCRVEDCDKKALRRAELPSDPDEQPWWSECMACGDKMDEDEYRDWTRRYAKWAEAAFLSRLPATLENLPGVA